MKTIGLLGGTGWSSTIGYYKLLNELVSQRLGGYHSAKILLKSIDYHDIKNNYGKNHTIVASLLQQELEGLLALPIDCLIICCNSLHKYFDMIKHNLTLKIPVFHAVELVAQHLVKAKRKRVLLLATRFTMEDGFFAQILENYGIHVTIPPAEDCHEMQQIHAELMQNHVTADARDYFQNLIGRYSDLEAVILGCTEYSLVVDTDHSVLPIVDPVYLQTKHAVTYALFGEHFGDLQEIVPSLTSTYL